MPVFEKSLKSEVPIRVTRKKTLVTQNPEILTKLKQDFLQKQCVLLPGFLDPSILKEIQSQIWTHKYYRKRHKGLASELCMNNNALSWQIHFFLNDEKIFQFVQKITECEPIGCFHGRVYHMVPNEGHYHRWHTDWNDHRILGFSMNLSRGVYEGGSLQIRNEKTQELYQDIRNIGFGDALLFRLSADLEHRVTDVTGSETKSAFAGWFSVKPKYLAQLKSSIKSSKKS